LDERAFDERYRYWAQRSGELFTMASRYIPGGAGSSARTVKFGWKPYPPFMAEGLGSRLRDVDGHEYVDYLLGLGPMILGHRSVLVRMTEEADCPGRPRSLTARGSCAQIARAWKSPGGPRASAHRQAGQLRR
jgi:glutamate-1-semialdehyde 2,1-aminomutase